MPHSSHCDSEKDTADTEGFEAGDESIQRLEDERLKRVGQIDEGSLNRIIRH